MAKNSKIEWTPKRFGPISERFKKPPNKIVCPCCQGKGSIQPPPQPGQKKDKNGVLSAAAKRLRKEGFTIRDIAAKLGFKNPGSITNLLNKK